MPIPRLRNVVAVLVFVTFMVAAASYLRYPGITAGVVRQLRYATFHENRNLWSCVTYWLEFTQKLSYDPTTQVWSFRMTTVEGLSDFEKGRLAFHRGDFSAAASLLEADVKAHGESESRLFWLAMTYLRLGEAENCFDGGSMTCSLPITVFHHAPEHSRQAARLFERLLDRFDPSNDLYRWLLNVSAMPIHEFPDGVPERYRIRSPFIDAFYGPRRAEVEARHPELSFSEGARELGIVTANTGRGVAVEDFTHSGFLDVVTCNTFEAPHLFRNEGGHFVDRTIGSGLESATQCFAVVPVDYDNDGFVDLFIGRPFSHYSLFRNDGRGVFRDVTVETGLWNPADGDAIAATWIPAWGDVNNDGTLDLFLAQMALRNPFVTGLVEKPRLDSALFINEHGHFVNRTREYGLDRLVRDSYFVGAAFGDYDRDGFADLLVSSPLRGGTRLLRNLEGRRFVETSAIEPARSAFTAGFLDVNHDGLLDIFLGGFGDARTATEQVVFGRRSSDVLAGRSSLLIQQPDGRFVPDDEAFDMPMATMGASWGDLTNSGCYDFYFGTGGPEPWFILPNLMYMGKPDGVRCSLDFDNVSMLQGFGNLQKGHGIVFFDFDNDGRQDVFSSLGGMWPGDRWVSQLFINRSHTSNTWTKIRLRGRRTNSYGIGAMIRVEAENAASERIVRYAYMDQKTGFGAGPFLAHIGLLNAVRIDRVDVTWPATHCTASYRADLERINVLDEEPCLTTAAK